uniref:Mediator of RNA polymerase II transcription subunit 28 n=1 Tax=Nannospalax galili TaxID=1026970 RepID=A0A8C6R271_NANGA
MAAALGGMFSGQLPRPATSAGPPRPGLEAPRASRPQNSTLVDKLESLSEACFDHVNGTDQEEIRTGVDQCIQKFLDTARQTECFFLQKRLQLSVQKPEQVTKEDVKDALVQKHLTKLRHWQQALEDVNLQHKKPTEIPRGSLTYLEQASANIPAPLKQP